MDNGAEERSAMMLFERNDLLVCDAFRNGDLDYVDAAGELSETDFFRAIAGKKILEKLAASYPSGLRSPYKRSASSSSSWASRSRLSDMVLLPARSADSRYHAAIRAIFY